MNFYYKKDTLFVDITNEVSMDMIFSLERKVFRILDDYGIDKIIISIFKPYDVHLFTSFKQHYYHKYRGYLVVRGTHILY